MAVCIYVGGATVSLCSCLGGALNFCVNYFSADFFGSKTVLDTIFHLLLQFNGGTMTSDHIRSGLVQNLVKRLISVKFGKVSFLNLK